MRIWFYKYIKHKKINSFIRAFIGDNWVLPEVSDIGITAQEAIILGSIIGIGGNDKWTIDLGNLIRDPNTQKFIQKHKHEDDEIIYFISRLIPIILTEEVVHSFGFIHENVEDWSKFFWDQEVFKYD